MLMNGEWQAAWDPYQKTSENGDFIRQTSSFRHWVTKDGSAGRTGRAGFKAEPNRYHLYVALICPWASRALMVRKLKKLESVISISIVDPRITEQGWGFAGKGLTGLKGASEDHLHHKPFIHQLYTHADPKVSGRATVPVLWDKFTDTIVNNESADIIEMLNSAFDQWGDASVNLRPQHWLVDINQLNPWLYEHINNAVYQAGFAQSQAAYKEAVSRLFAGLEALEQRLSDGRDYLLGDELSEVDVRLFVTLVRFDAAYVGAFKCNLKQLQDYPLLSDYLQRIYVLQGVSETVNIEHIKQGYYSVKALNPSGIVPIGPNLTFLPANQVAL
ncbi:glutathione S-transferase family protein [Agarivorans sp. 1_MG-2023]|uniref:glutathione S-transferase family protein n=1 Tax=Agarivorans sp. 1_MG-2023 TaxID=3062634 RepID=UPI0026E15F5F|nr:glutathione S-transferase family protein [Agarivorans sp. 1_MG-2023]MDO6763113.1 glutathione S-transferase family protein [Agarivorans sp. 1_MG-2023]